MMADGWVVRAISIRELDLFLIEFCLCRGLRFHQYLLSDCEIQPLLSCEVLSYRFAVRPTKAVDAFGRVPADVDLSIGVCTLLNDLHLNV